MEFLVPVFRILHFIGLALLLGGTYSSYILVKKSKPNLDAAKIAYNCSHLITAPGLTLLILTGVLQSWALYWEHFKGAGYMHAKVLLVVILFALIFYDIKILKKIIRHNSTHLETERLLSRRQCISLLNCILTFLIIILVGYRPF